MHKLVEKLAKEKGEWPKDDATEKFVKFCPNKKNNKNDYNLGMYKESIYPYIPRQIMDELELISPDPPVWLVGQFAKYVLRPKPWFLKEILAIGKTHPGN